MVVYISVLLSLFVPPSPAPWICISNELSNDADAARLEHTLRTTGLVSGRNGQTILDQGGSLSCLYGEAHTPREKLEVKRGRRSLGACGARWEEPLGTFPRLGGI